MTDLEAKIKRVIKPLDKLISRAKELAEHPDAVLLNDSYEKLSKKKEILNLNYPSKP